MKATHDRDAFLPHLLKWLPDAKIQWKAHVLKLHDNDKRHHGDIGLNGEILWPSPVVKRRWLIDIRLKLANQDVGLVAHKLKNMVNNLLDYQTDKLLVLAPYIRRQQAEYLEAQGIDYLDLAGNVHFEAPGLHIHVEGKQPPKLRSVQQVAMSKGWVRSVLALLLRPDFVGLPQREIADLAEVSTGTMSLVMSDLRKKGYLVGRRSDRRLVRSEELLALWVDTYRIRLRPKLDEVRLQIREENKHNIWELLRIHLDEKPLGQWALTGADGALLMDNYFVAPETEIYLIEPEVLLQRQLLEKLGAQPAKRGNLRIIKAPSFLAMSAAQTIRGYPVAPPLLVYSELVTRGTDQAMEAAERLHEQVMRNHG